MSLKVFTNGEPALQQAGTDVAPRQTDNLNAWHSGLLDERYDIQFHLENLKRVPALRG